MTILNLITLLLWIALAGQSGLTFYKLRDQGMSQRETVTVTILLLAGLNICIGLISLGVDVPVYRLLGYFYAGSSVFQVLLSSIVLKYIKNN